MIGLITRKKAEEEIHKHIRLQTAEELLKRVDTGFGQKARAPFQAIVEGVQNSADAIDKAREALLKSTGKDDYDAEIKVEVEVIDKSRGEIRISVQDNGIGIPRDKVKVIVRAGGTGTIEYKASRSQQGIGWKAAAIYANQSTGKPVEIISKTFFEPKAHRHVYDYSEGKVTKLIEEDYGGEFPEHGTRMTLNIIGDYSRARGNILEFIKRMAAIHPYITFILKENGNVIEYPKRSNVGIPIPSPVPPHPNSVDIGQLKDMLTLQLKNNKKMTLASFLKKNFCRIGDKSIKELMERVRLLKYLDERGFFAGDIIKRVAQSGKSKKIKKNKVEVEKYLKTLVRDVEIDYGFVAELVVRGRLNQGATIRNLNNEELKKFFKIKEEELPTPPFNAKTKIREIVNDEEKVRLLAEVLRSMGFPSPPVDSLMPIPDEVMISGFCSIYKPEKHVYIKRKPTSSRGRPLQVQVLGMYGGEIREDNQEKIIRIANCTPLIYEFGSDIVTQTAKEIDWGIYKLGKKGMLPQAPVIFVVHVTCPQLRYLGVAKQAIGADDVIANEVKKALQAAGRQLAIHVSRKEKSKLLGKIRKFLEANAKVVGYSLSKIINVKEEEVFELLKEEIHRRRSINESS